MILFDWLQENPLPWLYYEHDRLVFVVDNHILSTYRKCPEHFKRRLIEGLYKKRQQITLGSTLNQQKERVWFLEFGLVIHKVMEHYYLEFRKADFKRMDFVLEVCQHYWDGMKMDEFSSEKEYQLIGGFKGFVTMMLQFVTHYSAENESIRVLKTEIGFGKKKEVPLSVGSGPYDVYLSGRIDILADTGHFIVPIDHKSYSIFKGMPQDRYIVDEGPTGYVYALKKILPSVVPQDLILKRDCNRIMMNLLQKKPTDSAVDRFKRFTIYKTDEQLETYRQRMLVTVEKLFNDMARIADGKVVDRDTNYCDSWFFRECPFKDICRQQSKVAEDLTIRNGYVKLPIWDTETVSNEPEKEMV